MHEAADGFVFATCRCGWPFAGTVDPVSGATIGLGAAEMDSALARWRAHALTDGRLPEVFFVSDEYKTHHRYPEFAR